MHNQGPAALCGMFLWLHDINTAGKVGRIDAATHRGSREGHTDLLRC